MDAKYDRIGTNYNATRKADPFLVCTLTTHLNPQKGGLYLDIGCGTGNYTSALQQRRLRMIGIDPSAYMLSRARSNNPKIEYLPGRAEKIDLPDNHVDGIIGSLTIHHWTDLPKGFSSLHRVLKPGGNIVIFTSTPEQMRGYWLNHYFPKMLSDSIAQMPGLEQVKEAMTSSGFVITGTDKYFIQPDLQDQFLYCGKHQPELYFHEQVRQGISSFSSLANRTEVEQGLAHLRIDINSGKINEVIDEYENDSGDYLFLVAKKAGYTDRSGSKLAAY